MLFRSDGVRQTAHAIAQTCGGLAAVFSGEGEHWTYALVHSNGTDIAALVKAMNTALHGRGGGRKGFAQGSLDSSAETIRGFWASHVSV